MECIPASVLSHHLKKTGARHDGGGMKAHVRIITIEGKKREKREEKEGKTVRLTAEKEATDEEENLVSFTGVFVSLYLHPQAIRVVVFPVFSSCLRTFFFLKEGFSFLLFCFFFVTRNVTIYSCLHCFCQRFNVSGLHGSGWIRDRYSY